MEQGGHPTSRLIVGKITSTSFKLVFMMDFRNTVFRTRDKVWARWHCALVSREVFSTTDSPPRLHSSIHRARESGTDHGRGGGVLRAPTHNALGVRAARTWCGQAALFRFRGGARCACGLPEPFNAQHGCVEHWRRCGVGRGPSLRRQDLPCLRRCEYDERARRLHGAYEYAAHSARARVSAADG